MVERANSVISGDIWNWDASTISLSSPHIVREGWLEKRGEHFKNWRKRYFFIFDNGMLLGFKEKPEHDLKDPANNFHVKGCQILKTEKPKANTFILRGLHWTTVIVRTFNASTSQERQAWIDDIKKIRDKLDETSSASDMEICSEGPSSISGFDQDSVLGVTPRHGNSRKITLNDFESLKVLGKGTFGKVILCRQKTTKKLYAIKILRKDVIISREEVTHTITENRVLQKIDHPFLIRLKCSFTTADRLFFVLEYANGGELFFHLSKDLKFEVERAKFYGAEICLALGYLHEHSIIYRDLKLENILLDAMGHIKVADFGLCKEDIPYGTTTKTFCGTPEYLPPEVLEESDYGRSVDWWGYGVCLYEMMVGRLPFYHHQHEVLYSMIRNDEVRFPINLPVEAKDFLRSLLVKDPQRRLGGGPSDSKDVMSHPFYFNIDWDMIYRKQVTPPFKPQVSSETDTRYFGDEFTEKPVDLSPIDEDGQLTVIEEELEDFEGCLGPFEQFSYQATSSTMGSSVASNLNIAGHISQS